MAYFHTYRERELARKKVRRKKMTTIILPDRKAKGSSRNFTKPQRVTRPPVLGDAITTTERAIWLTV